MIHKRYYPDPVILTMGIPIVVRYLSEDTIPNAIDFSKVDLECIKNTLIDVFGDGSDVDIVNGHLWAATDIPRFVAVMQSGYTCSIDEDGTMW